MSDNSGFTDLRYDFSSLSKNRLRAYNRMVEEFERISREQECGTELSDEALEMLAAAGTPQQKPNGIKL